MGRVKSSLESHKWSQTHAFEFWRAASLGVTREKYNDIMHCDGEGKNISFIQITSTDKEYTWRDSSIV